MSMIKDKEKFSTDLRDFFKKLGLTQQNIADRLNVSQSYVGMLMSGAKPFGKATAQTWSETFGLSVAWLLTGEGDISGNVVQQHNQNGDNIQGNGVTVNKPDYEYLALLKKKDEQIDRLINIIEKLQG